MKHFFCFVGIVLSLKSAVYAKSADSFSIEDRFKEETFVLDDIKNHAKTPNSFKETKFNEKGIRIRRPRKPMATRNQFLLSKQSKELWLETGSTRKIDTNVLDRNTFYDILVATQCLYQTTKRYKQDGLLFPQNKINSNSSNVSPAFRKLITDRKVKIAGFIYGTHGAAKIKENGIMGMIAYKEILKGSERQIQIFAIEEGSQGENFQFLGGVGGASWMTNFNAKKVNVDPKNLEIPNRFLLNSEQKLSLHEGFYNKIISSKISTEGILKSLFEKLKIKNFNTLNLNNSSISGIELREQVDKVNKCSIKLYIVGHSQGGGLTQIAAPYITSWVGKYLYGNNFDNKVFNIAHAICLSPARAIGDANTLKAIENVMGRQNILGYCSYADPVPCLPLGSNVGYDPVKERGMKLLMKIGKVMSKVLKEPYKSFLNTVCGMENFYETLNVWAYEDPFFLIERYCTLSITDLQEYVNCLNKDNFLPIECLQNPKLKIKNQKKKNIVKAKKKIKSLKGTQSKIKDIKQSFMAVQNAYFEAHTTDVKASNKKILAVAKNLICMLKNIKVKNFVAAQHFGTYTCLKFKPLGGERDKTYLSLDCLFNADLLKSDLQAAMNLGVEYHKNKAKKVKK